MRREDALSIRRQARLCAAAGNHEAAIQLSVGIVTAEPPDVTTLIELATVASLGGFKSAALSAFEQAIRIAPDNAAARTGAAYLLSHLGDPQAAIRQYRCALASDPAFVLAHQGLARTLDAIGDPAAEHHFRIGFTGHSVVRMPYRGAGSGIPMLLLTAARGGNIDTGPWLDDRVFAATCVYADFHGPEAPLPDAAVIVNAIGDADLCGTALHNAGRLLADSGKAEFGKALLNHPDRVRDTGRLQNAARLGALPHVRTPRMLRLARANVASAARLGFPLLLRSPGFHTGQHFVRVDTEDSLLAAAAALPRDEVLAIEYLDASGPDGMARKYRVMFIDGKVLPLHLAIAADWKVHYFTSDMASCASFRREEQAFLNDMPKVLGPRAIRALHAIQSALGLDYAGADFAIAPNGSVLLFEANATMVIAQAEAGPQWDYRRPSIEAALTAARDMVMRRARFGLDRADTDGVAEPAA